MELFEAMALRHSYRGTFKNVAVPQEDLRKIVTAGIQAPSGCNAQTTRFCIVDDPSLLSAIRELIPKPSIQTAPAIIAVVSEKRIVSNGMDFEAQDYAAAVQNMLLAITGLGYASVWLDGVLRVKGLSQKLHALLHLPGDANLTVSVLLPVGVPQETGRQNGRLPFEQRAWFNRHS